jgi:uncharacterized protein with von Willebrand factor type A (vWA) domain
MSHLLENLLLFGRVLRGLGLEVSPGRMRDLVVAADQVGLGSRDDFRSAARCLLVHRREDLALFEAAFAAFWRKPTEGSTHLDLRALGEKRRFRRPRFAASEARLPPSSAGEDSGPSPTEPPLLAPVLSPSAREVLRHKDFAEMSAAERAEVEAFVRRAGSGTEDYATRRRRPGRGPFIDVRRTLRQSQRRGGEVLTWARLEREERPRPLVVLADISGSMERYTRVLLLFMYGLAESGASPLEAFVFSTRLTRISRHLRGRDLEAALREVARAVPDWSGGTRIGECLHAFNFEWGRRVLGRRPVVLVMSDGWERGEVALLAEEAARLRRSCRRLVWLNPLLGAPDYEPLARGMKAVLPHVDDFLPVHNLVSLEDLGRHLATLRGGGKGPRPSFLCRSLHA